MALSATIFKAALQISDMDRNYYAEHLLTLARHPSETDERMMLRLLAFALHADEQLNFTKGLCADDEPDLWQKTLTNEIELWIDVGLPDERRIRKACNRSKQVYLYSYGRRGVDIWWQKIHSKLQRFDNLNVIEIPDESMLALGQMAQRNMQLQCTVQEGEIWLNSDEKNCSIAPIVRMAQSNL
jgi:uncharacterized protein YaeQ